MKKVLVHDERTSCMKLDLHIAMNVDAIKNEGKLKSASGNSIYEEDLPQKLALSPKNDLGEVPEENLPEPFNLVMHTGTSNASIPSLIEQDVDQSSNEGRISASSAPQVYHHLIHILTPLEKKDLDNEASSVGTATIQGTPAKLVSTPDANHVGGLSVDNNIFDILPENLLESIKEKERQALEEKDPAISQAKRRQKMIASLPKLFDMIRFLFQSIKHSVVTKEEFMHRIVANHLDIVDRREVEEQLKLLQELAPEWIYEKLASGGGLLIWQAFHLINKMFSPDSMRARLVEAK
ncbi:hypothetical protein C3L33_07459, partial [Rhododendron williamsianum]